jgi:hypothetical protein
MNDTLPAAYTQEEQPEREALEFTDLSEIKERPPQPPFLIEGLLHKGDKMLVSGPSKAGKSYLLLELGIAVATGSSWLGSKCQQGTVLYLNLEIRKDAFGERYWKIKEATGLEPESKQLIALNLRGSGSTNDGKEFIDSLIEEIFLQGLSPALIIVDPFYKLGVGDENAMGDVHQVLKRLDELAAVTGASIALVHHHPKYTQGHKSPIDRASGSGVFGRDFDTIVDLMELDATCAMDAEIERHKKMAIGSIGSFGSGNICQELMQRSQQWTAWRVEFVTRHVAPPSSMNIWWQHPVHVLDEAGLLGSAEYATQAKKQSNTQKGKRMLTLVETLERLASSGNIAPTYSELEDATGLDRATIGRYLEKLPDYEAQPIQGRKAHGIVKVRK